MIRAVLWLLNKSLRHFSLITSEGNLKSSGTKVFSNSSFSYFPIILSFYSKSSSFSLMPGQNCCLIFRLIYWSTFFTTLTRYFSFFLEGFRSNKRVCRRNYSIKVCSWVCLFSTVMFWSLCVSILMKIMKWPLRKNNSA